MCYNSTSQSYSTILAFWLMGALNNVPYTVMLAGAKSISEGGTALVFLANITPGLLIKLSGPYWFEKVTYKRRIGVGSALMTLSFLLVATFGYLKQKKEIDSGASGGTGDNQDDAKNGLDFYLVMQLLGVACCSTQSSLGEATLLALSGKIDSLQELSQTTNDSSDNLYMDDDDTHTHSETNTKSWNITAFSSGTGLAGVLGFAYVVFFTDVLKMSLTVSLYFAITFPILYQIIYQKYLHEFTTDYGTLNDETSTALNTELESETESERITNRTNTVDSDEDAGQELASKICQTNETQLADFESFHDNPSSSSESFSEEEIDNSPISNSYVKTLSAMERLKLTFSFWPFMVPLFVVYAAEYALQSGVWSAIGFPVEKEDARNSFYVKSNWLYQVGVFISRSSGTLFTAPMWVLWLMPLLQCVNLVVFYLVASHHFWYNNILLIGCFYVGLLGGGVYVNGYMRVNRDLHVSIREFALSTVSIADSLGIVFADFSGLFIQSCLYKSNGIDGAVVQCPF